MVRHRPAARWPDARLPAGRRPDAGENRLHLDLGAPDLDAEVERLTGVGASVVEPRRMGDFRWVTMADPDGNEFCVAEH
ncbi:VOC family protein [Janibacter hoylei]|uniref:VOC family protein n=1 Tax=Janibacter hoylei TaxID=364298 RepID=UPI002AA29B4D|nr:VOC family protein [Janibacter hoylei]